MMKPLAALAVMIAAVTSVPAIRDARAQATAPLSGARLNHVAIAVRDIKASLTAFSDIVGVEPPPTRAVLLDAVGGGKVGWTVAFINTPNFFLELDQPADDVPSATREFLAKYGPGIQHIGFGIDGPLAPVIEGLQQKGGVLTIATGRAAFVDLTSVIGMVVELVQGRTSPSPIAPPTDPQRLAANPLDHVAFTYRNAQSAVAAFAGLMGVAAPTLTTTSRIDYLPAAHAGKNATFRSAQIATGAAALEIIEPVGAPSPWAQHLSERSGTPPHHLAFRFADQAAFAAAVRRLQEKGGVWVSGRRGVAGTRTGTSPAFAFDAFGITIELIGPSAAA